MCLDGVDLVGGEAGVGERLADDALLGEAVRRGEAVAGAVLVDGGAADHGQHRVPVAQRVGEAGQDEHARAFGEAGAVGRRGERLDPPVGREAALEAERGERSGAGDDGDAAREREAALAALQRPHRQVQGGERAGAGGVDGERGPLEAEGVGDAPGHDAGQVAGQDVGVEPVGGLVRAGPVFVRLHADEHAGGGAVQAARVDARPFEGFPAGLQQQPLLGVHGQGLARADLEEVGVEIGGVRQESAAPHVGGAGGGRVRVVQAVEVPAAVGGEVGDRVGAVGEDAPQVLGRGHPAGVAAADADDRDGLVRHRGGGGPGRRGGFFGFGGAVQHVRQVPGQGMGRRVVEGGRDGQVDAQFFAEPPVQLDQAERVQAHREERAVGRQVGCPVRVGVGVYGAQHGGGLRQHQFQHRGPGLLGHVLTPL